MLCVLTYYDNMGVHSCRISVLPPFHSLQLLQLILVLLNGRPKVSSTIIPLVHGDDARVGPRVEIGDVHELDGKFEDTVPLVSSQLNPQLVSWDGVIVPCEYARPKYLMFKFSKVHNLLL